MCRVQKFCCCISFPIGCTIISFFTFILCIGHLAEFFRIKENAVVYASDWLNILWGVLHLVAAMFLSYSILVRRSLIPILTYIIIETFYLMYVIIYASVSCALGTNTIANYGPTFSILFWIFVVQICGITIYFLYFVTPYYFLRRQQRNAANQEA
ncbi:uncharacterized protein LOC108028490 isoform X2 [Drosophila biarmipes]|uniref:uncharacterized protein LOC108028490 isoform X2 n=1 Tax=Drosophila biarmipes TaxID=125945 RepID=UPI0021CCC4DD|nr:uncharacterized protein LOC108028490 isoform X2 [Drosophila biarmipes]